jgi:hypothetical protein
MFEVESGKTLHGKREWEGEGEGEKEWEGAREEDGLDKKPDDETWTTPASNRGAGRSKQIDGNTRANENESTSRVDGAGRSCNLSLFFDALNRIPAPHVASREGV